MADDICVRVVLVIWCVELSYFINQRALKRVQTTAVADLW